jgi:hypothetical protein
MPARFLRFRPGTLTEREGTCKTTKYRESLPEGKTSTVDLLVLIKISSFYTENIT